LYLCEGDEQSEVETMCVCKQSEEDECT
jgi:hypothetical protein